MVHPEYRLARTWVVMRGLVPRIHVFLSHCGKNVDGRHKAGHDEQSESGEETVNPLFFTVSGADLQGAPHGFSTRIGAPFSQAAMSSTAPP
jgi:hypothetical protein